MSSKIRIFTSPHCPPCQEIKKKLEKQGMPDVEIIDVHSDEGYKEAMEKKITGVPFAIKNDKQCRILQEGDSVKFECQDEKDGL